MRWLINIPVWGEAYRLRWLERGLPAILDALKFAGRPEHRWIIHTDGITADFELPPGRTLVLPRPYEIVTSRELGRADQVGFKLAEVGEAVMFLNADMVPSREVFVRCAEIFNTTAKTFVSCPAIRTRDEPPPLGASGEDLAQWAWPHRHKFTEDCVWQRGGCKLPPYVIVEKDDVPGNIVMHAWDLHPLAIFKDYNFDLLSPTASEFIGEVPWRQVYVVRSASEMVIAEPCAGQLDYARFKNRAYSKQDVVSWARHCFTARNQQLQFRQQIVLMGLGDPQAQGIANDLYRGVMRPVRHRWHWLSLNAANRIRLGLLVPRPIRRLFPKGFRKWFVEFEWPRFRLPTLGWE